MRIRRVPGPVSLTCNGVLARSGRHEYDQPRYGPIRTRYALPSQLGAFFADYSPANGSSRSTRTSIENADAAVGVSYRCQPQHDLQLMPHRTRPRAPQSARQRDTAAVLVNAILKSTFASSDGNSWRTGRSGSGSTAAAQARAALARMISALAGHLEPRPAWLWRAVFRAQPGGAQKRRSDVEMNTPSPGDE